MRLQYPTLVGFVLSLTGGVFALDYNVSLNSQVRSAFHSANGMTVSWNTYDQLSQPTVMYGLAPNDLNMVATSSVSVTYNTSLTFNNHVQLANLFPNTQYYYMPTQLIAPVTTIFSFTTSRPLGDDSPYVLAYVADMGTMGPEGLTTTAGNDTLEYAILKPGEQNTIQSLISEIDNYNFLAHIGDIAYADAWLKEVDSGFLNATATYAEAYKAYESILDDFYDELVPITGQVPYMVLPGNHEGNCVDAASPLCMPGQENFTGFINHFRMPSDVETQAANNPGTLNMWYSFDDGMVHYVMIDTETDFTGAPDVDFPAGPFAAAGEQQAWLAADLAAVNRSVTPWIVLGMHRPWYTSGAVCTACQTAFEAIIDEYNVDIVYSGHYHVYERNTAVGLNGTVDPAGLDNPSAPIYIVNGLGGHYDGLDTFVAKSEWQVFGIDEYNATYGWSLFDFHNCTHVTHSMINSSNNQVVDQATLYKARTCELTNNYVLPGYGPAVQLPGALVVPSGLIATEAIGTWNPSACGILCNAQSGCAFFVVYTESNNGVVEGSYCALYSEVWSPQYATNLGSSNGCGMTAISNAYSYTLA